MINLLYEHFGKLGTLFIVTLLIITEYKGNPSQKSNVLSKESAHQKTSNAMLFWIKMIALMQGLILSISILNYFQPTLK